MNKCVYVHYNIFGKPFYVGRGNLDRAYSKHGRNKSWKLIANCGYRVAIIEKSMTEEQSVELEQFLLEFIPNLINIKRNSDERLDYHAVDWVNTVYYDESSPTCIRYLHDTNCRNPKFKKFKNDPAGYLRFGNSYGRIEVKGNSYAIHRVVWLLHYGVIDSDKSINHINNDPTDNRIVNLEMCSTSENNNRKIIHNTLKSNITSTGHANISTRVRKGKLKMYCGIKIQGKIYSKQLCVDSLGYDFCLNQLIDFRNSKIASGAKEN